MSHFRTSPFEHRTASTIAPFHWTSTFHRSLDEVFIFSAPAQQSEVAQKFTLKTIQVSQWKSNCLGRYRGSRSHGLGRCPFIPDSSVLLCGWIFTDPLYCPLIESSLKFSGWPRKQQNRHRLRQKIQDQSLAASSHLWGPQTPHCQHSCSNHQHITWPLHSHTRSHTGFRPRHPSHCHQHFATLRLSNQHSHLPCEQLAAPTPVPHIRPAL